MEAVDMDVDVVRVTYKTIKARQWERKAVDNGYFTVYKWVPLQERALANYDGPKGSGLADHLKRRSLRSNARRSSRLNRGE